MTEDIRELIEPEPKPKKSLSISAIISSITGIFAYFVLFFHTQINLGTVLALILAPISALVAIFTGHRAKRQIRRREGTMFGKKFANLGLFLGYLYIIVGILIVVLLLAGVSWITGSLGSLLGIGG